MTDILQCTPMRAAETNTPPGLRPAAGRVRHPLPRVRARLPARPGPALHVPRRHRRGQYLAMTEALGIERMVLVQPTYYGTDNSLLATS